MKQEIILLNLLNPLFYVSEKIPDAFANPFENTSATDLKKRETLYCFEIDERAAVEFEPGRQYFPGTMVFAGRISAEKIAENNKNNPALLELPRGNYVFSQMRGFPGKDEIISLIIEVQQECLWQRLVPGPGFYLRYIYEDNSPVIQVFRPYKNRETL